MALPDGPGPDGPAVPDIGPDCPIRVERPSMRMEWNQLTFLHWDYDPEVVQALLPPGLRVDSHQGRAWVGLVPFLMVVAPPRGSAVPWLSYFCETNVRTYATAADGSRGVWFLSLDAARLPAVLTARLGYGLPYFWSAMSYHRAADVVAYRCRRRWPRPAAAPSLVRMRIGEAYRADELTPLDHFLTARWRLYSRGPRGLRSALAQHDPWSLHRAELIDLDDSLMAAAGLPAPSGPPRCHWSPGVAVRIGLPRRLAP
jgi:uncharacterized protein YqjF (DUF2071 family)